MLMNPVQLTYSEGKTDYAFLVRDRPDLQDRKHKRELVFCVLDQRVCCCKQHMHIQKNWHEEEEAEWNFIQQMGPVGPIWHTNQKNNQLPLLAFLQQIGRILILKDTFTFITLYFRLRSNLQSFNTTEVISDKSAFTETSYQNKKIHPQ